MAFIAFNRKYKGHLAMVVPAAKAREIQDFLDNPPDDLTDDQSDFLLAIKQIYPGTRPQQPENGPDERLHPGIEQSTYSAIPNGDR